MSKQGEAKAFERVPETKGDSKQVANKKDKNVLLISLPPAHVLLLDDDDGVRRSLGDDLVDAGFEVDRAETTFQAKQYLTGGAKYDVAFVDIMLKKDDLPGDDFILANLDLLRSTKVAAITAENIQAERLAALMRNGVETIQKLLGVRKKLIEFVEVEMERRRAVMNEEIQIHLNSAGDREHLAKPKNSFSAMLQQLLLDWLRSRSAPQKKRIYYGGSLYSYSDIADEIENETELGQAHLKMMANLFMRSMNLE